MYRTKDIYGEVKYVSRSKAKVIDNRDPLQRGRIRVEHPLIDKHIWLDFLRDASQFSVPSIGDVVYVEAEAGVPEYSIASGTLVAGSDENPLIPSEFKRDIPTNRGIYSPNGHLIELDDGIATPSNALDDKSYTTENRGVRVTSSANNKIHIIEDSTSNNQYILIQDAGGNLIKLDYANNQLTINSIGTTKIDTSGDKSETVGSNDSLIVSGDKTETISGKLTINVSGDVSVQCNKAIVQASGDVSVTSGGTASIDATEITLNGSTGDILTTVTDPVVDTIFGIPTTGVTTVKSG